jgi:hypothetical protein
MKERAGPDDYYGAIEEEFVRRRGSSMLLSPRDWGLIGAWKEAGIPLRIVLQGISNAFDAFERRAAGGGAGARRINSLSYCRQEVLALDELYRTMQGVEAGRGPSGDAPRESSPVVVRHLGRLHRAARAAMAAAAAAGLDPLVASLARAAAEIRSLRKEIKRGTFDPGRIEDGLRRLDGGVLEAARGALPVEEVKTMEDAADRTLEKQRSRMRPEAFAATRRTLLARVLRRRCRLPRLTLFD